MFPGEFIEEDEVTGFVDECYAAYTKPLQFPDIYLEVDIFHPSDGRLAFFSLSLLELWWSGNQLLGWTVVAFPGGLLVWSLLTHGLI